MAFFRQAAPVIPGDRCHHQVLHVRVAQELAMADQIPAVLVVGGDVDALATGVQLGRGPEQLPSFAATLAIGAGAVVMQQSPGLVVEAQGMVGHAVSPGEVHPETAGQMEHGALPDGALEREAIAQQLVAQHPVHDQPFPQGPVTHHNFPGPQHGHGGLQDQCPGHDDLGAAFVDRRQGTPLLRGHAHQPGHQLVDPFAAEPVALQFQRRCGVVDSGQGRQCHGGAAGAHQLGAFPRSQCPLQFGHRRIQGALDVGLQKPSPIGGKWIDLAELALQPHRTDARAGQHAGIGAIGQHQFG